LKEGLQIAIDVSPHDPATAYIATTRYKFNDKTPALYKTTDYGKNWTNITGNIPDGAYTRVVREDEKRRGLLFAGTETGLYVSWNDGKVWEPLQLNLPVTPILDLKVRHDDLIVATSGRSFWVLDDLAVLRQRDDKTTAPRLFQPEDIYLVSGGSELDGNSSDGTNPLRGVNPASGVVFYYHLPAELKGKTVSLELLDATGKTINTYSSKKTKDFKSYPGGPGAEPTLGKSAGLNRFVWNLRHRSMPGIPTAYIEGSYRGHKAGPGTYTARLTVDGKTSETPFTIKANPLYPNNLDYAEYDRWMSEMEAELTAMHELTNTLHAKKERLRKVMNDLPKGKKYQAVKTKAKDLIGELAAWDERMVQRRSKAYDDVENFPNKFTANYLFLINATESSIPVVNQGTKDRRKELDARWLELKTEGEQLLHGALPALEKELWGLGIGAL
ncbi:MAG: glycosyl hydrolase, partial [Bacteroidota bacterium]